jgi:hypothetical protein
MTTPGTTKPVRRTFLVADVKCYMCGTISGTIESEQHAPTRNTTFRMIGHTEARPILDWRQLRCVKCEGRVFLDEPDYVTRRFEEYNWLDERPRRGRPPKRLVEERRRERELLESQAA